ncbi:hypothetical protein MTY66_53230 [Mycolicibacterium sp. TY66]|nr:hypothetical protein MTY66_53230 [Mycolicibacterium sp. TY66]
MLSRAAIRRCPTPAARTNSDIQICSAAYALRSSTVTGNNTCVTKHDRHRARRGRTAPARPTTRRERANPPTTQHALRARRASDQARRQPGLDADQISLYRHHQCLRALQRGTLRARQDFSGVPRDPSIPRHTDGAHDQDQPGDHTNSHIDKLNDE